MYRPVELRSQWISIHALREEGDLSGAAAGVVCLISIHALREEGDRPAPDLSRFLRISIHALREEGDTVSAGRARRAADFYPRPPRGGRLYAGITNSKGE